MTTVLGIPFAPHVAAKWRAWLAPDVQPFFVDDAADLPTGRSLPASALTPELRDTYKAWRLRDVRHIVWLDEADFMSLDRARRRSLVRSQVDGRRGAVPSVRRWRDLVDGDVVHGQADGHRFVWWPSMLRSDPHPLLERFAADEGDVTRHRTVADSTWKLCRDVLPQAEELAGTFADGSGPNCFGTVMAAAGVPGAAHEWVQQEPFDEWLQGACVPGGHDRDAGTVLVWRDAAGLPVHAAVTIGDGYALEKPAQTWWTPRITASVEEVKRASRASGQRLERHRIVASLER